MVQPVKKVIKEIHPELTNKTIYTLLVDGTNILRRCFSDTKVNTNGVHYGGIFQFLLQLKKMMQTKTYDYIYVFFDDSDSGILRYKIYNDYKANRDKNYAEHADGISDYMKEVNAKIKSMQNYLYNKNKKKKEKSDSEKLVDENFARERDRLCEYFNELFIRWIFNDKTEGDDLIAYYVLNKKPEEKIVIMSADEDLTQLISSSVCIYNPNLKKYLSYDNFIKYRGIPVENVLIKKIFCGDTSDNIGNIDGLSENRLFELIPEIKERPITIDEVKEKARLLNEQRIKEKKKPLKVYENIINGVSRKNYNGDFYEINDKIINLKKPLLTDEAKEDIDNMMYVTQDPSDRSMVNVYKMVEEDDILDLLDHDKFSNFFSSYKPFIDNEIRRYKEDCKKE